MPKHLRRSLLPALAALAILTGIPTVSAEGAPAHYIVFELDEAGRPEPVFARLVQLPSEPRSAHPEELAQATAESLDGKPVRAMRLEGPTGDVLYRSVASVPEWIRGEFHGAPTGGGRFMIDAYRFPVGRPAFVAVVPAVAGARLLVDGPQPTVFRMDRLLADAASLKHGASFTGETSSIVLAAGGGNPDNRVDLLLMGDGYTAAQSGLFDADADGLETDFFNVTPYSEYRNLVRVTRLFTASTQSGADHPPYDGSCSSNNLGCCADGSAQSDPLAGTYVDTAFDARYCAFNIHRLLVVNGSAVLSAASAVPTWDKILVLVNDGTYGGAGGSIGVTSTHPSAVGIARHEYGHSFTGLADEYESPFPGFPACSDVSGNPCEPNVTDETLASAVKWGPWIAPTTPVPTPETGTYSGDVGVFQGARYLSSGIYRPRQSCLMRTLGAAFGEVCSQEYILTLYDGGWGIPGAGIDLIEPGSESPPTAGTVDGSGGVQLSVDILQPIGAPAVSVEWLVDGTPQPAANGLDTFTFNPPGPGLYQVEVEVRDTTLLVHPDMALGLTEHSRTWTVEMPASGPPGAVNDLRMSRSSTTPGNVVFHWSPSCSPAANDYAVVEGILGVYYSHKAKDCTDDGTPFTEEITPSGFDAYYMVVSKNGVDEGSYGLDSTGNQRPIVGPTCLPTQSTVACP